MRKVWFALVVSLIAGGAHAQEAHAQEAQDKEMTIPRLMQIAGERSAAASSGYIAARVTRYRCLREGNAAPEAYERAVAAIVEALDAAPGGQPADSAKVAPPAADWAVETWYEIEYVFDKGRFRLSRTTPSGSYHTAFDGVASFRAEQRTLYVEPDVNARPHMEDIDINLMRWDQIPRANYVREDQEGGLKQVGGGRYNYWLRDKQNKYSVDQIFNAETGMIERGSARNADGQLLQEYLWLRPVMNGVWGPSAFVKMERRGDDVGLEVRTYSQWEARPVADEELLIPADAYDNVAGTALPVWRLAAQQSSGAGEPSAAAAVVNRRLAGRLEAIDELELSKTPPENYVMRTVGLSLIVIALGLIVLYWLRWRAES